MNVVKKLLENPTVKIITTYKTDRPFYYDDILKHERITAVQCDLTQKEDCSKITKGVDYAILAAAVSFGASFIQNNPLGLVNDNIVMNVNLLDACYKNGVKKVIYFGSTTGYPDDAVTMYEDNMFRLSNVYGPYDKFDLETSHVLPAMVRKFCEERFPLEVWGDGSDSRDLIYVEDAVDAVIKSLSCTGFNAYNIGAGVNYTVNDIINMLSNILEVKPEIKYLTNKPRMIQERYISVEKATKELGFTHTVDLNTGLKKTCEWFMQNKDKIYR